MQVSFSYGDFQVIKKHIEDIQNFCEGNYGIMGHGEVLKKIKRLAAEDSMDLCYLATTINELVQDWQGMIE